MPLNNDILGIYKAVYIYTSGVAVSYIVDSVTRSVSMEASPKVMMTGSPKTRIMDLGGVTETISIQAPILIGGGASADGRALLAYKVNEIIDTSTQRSLPILKSASISINEGGGNVSLTLESDGDLQSPSFFVENSNNPHPSLDPSVIGTQTGVGQSGATRVARFYDFRAKIGQRQYFIQEATVDVNVDTVKNYFINPYEFNNQVGGYKLTGNGGTTLASVLYPGGTGISWKYGTPFPHIGVNGITVSGKGKGAVVVGSNYASETLAGVTTQVAGKTILASSDDVSFNLEVAGYSSSGFGWSSLIPGIGLSKAIINATNFTVNTGILSVEFDFMCYVI
jgi:hypothetical protein